MVFITCNGKPKFMNKSSYFFSLILSLSHVFENSQVETLQGALPLEMSSIHSLRHSSLDKSSKNAISFPYIEFHSSIRAYFSDKAEYSSSSPRTVRNPLKEGHGAISYLWLYEGREGDEPALPPLPHLLLPHLCEGRVGVKNSVPKRSRQVACWDAASRAETGTG